MTLKALSSPKIPLPKLCEDSSCSSFYKNGEFNTAFPGCSEFGQCRRVDFAFGRTIGSGQYGEVVKGLHLSTGTEVAIKKIHRSKMRASAIRNEECGQHMVDHPTIRKHYCTISDVFNGYVYLVMEYVEGRPLAQVMKDPNGITENFLRHFTASLSVALHAIHLQDLTFSDMKPENVLLKPDGSFKIIDFGLSRKSFSCVPGTAAAYGTPLLWPPEFFPQDTDKCFSNPSADWWAFAITLHMLWTRNDDGPYDLESLRHYRWSEDGMHIIAFGELIQKRFSIDNFYTLQLPWLSDFILMMTEPNTDVRVGTREDGILERLFSHPWLEPLDVNHYISCAAA
jgi:serine/threonine protein kinase